MKLIKRFLPESLIGVSLVVVYFALRLTKIMSLPLFTDEAIYTRWSQIARYDASWRFISLTDGKQPMFVWWDMILMRFTHDPLFAGRLVSVICGLLTVLGLYFLGREVFKNKWVGIISAALYVIYPFGLVYDRMALYDSMVGMFTVWSLYLEFLLVRNPRAWVAFTLALIMGGGFLTKTSAFFSIYLLPVTLLAFPWKEKDRLQRLVKWIFFALIATFLANLYYTVLRLSPFYHIISDKNGIFVYPFNEWIHHPFDFFVGNFHGLWDWFITYLTWPMLLAVLISLMLQKKFTWEKIILVTFFAAPFLALALFGRIIYPRFILFMTLPLVPLIALTFYTFFTKLNRQYLGSILVILFSVMWLYADFFIVDNFQNAPIPQSDLAQYSNAWPAGWGIKEIISYLSSQAQSQKIFVLSEGTFGSLPTYAVEIYLGDNRNVQKQGIWPVPDNLPEDILQKAKEMPTFVILNQTQNPPISWPVTLVAKYKKGAGTDYMRLYKINKQ